MNSLTPLKHVAIIMDGNGRWAKKRGHSRFWGHIRGAKTARNIIQECAKLKIPYLTLFAFSTDNWRRPKEEVSFLMNLLCKQLGKEIETLKKNNIKFHVIGDLNSLPDYARHAVKKVVFETSNNTGTELFFALSYGGRQDIINACKLIAEKASHGELSASEINEEFISAHLSTPTTPDPDLIIRTSGEKRISNFMLWQAAYSEFYFSDKYWPDFTIEDFHVALNEFASKQRRFGLTEEQVLNNPL